MCTVCFCLFTVYEKKGCSSRSHYSPGPGSKWSALAGLDIEKVLFPIIMLLFVIQRLASLSIRKIYCYSRVGNVVKKTAS